MTAYIIPLFCLILTFMATLTCLRFILSREGLYWIIPCIISIILTLENLDTLLLAAETSIMPDYRTMRYIAPVLIAFLWYMMIITFHYALRFKIKVNRFRNENRKNRKEAEFIEKMERRKRRKEYILNEQNKENKAEKPRIYQNNGSDDWSDLFSD